MFTVDVKQQYNNNFLSLELTPIEKGIELQKESTSTEGIPTYPKRCIKPWWAVTCGYGVFWVSSVNTYFEGTTHSKLTLHVKFYITC